MLAQWRSQHILRGCSQNHNDLSAPVAKGQPLDVDDQNLDQNSP